MHNTGKAKVRKMSAKEDNVYKRLNDARRMFASCGAKKTGVNNFAGYTYFTLDDIVPAKRSILEVCGLTDIVTIDSEMATLTLINNDNEDQKITFTIPLVQDKSKIKNPIQAMGSACTYYRRYLYVQMLDIVEPDEIEITAGMPERGRTRQDSGDSGDNQESEDPQPIHEAREPEVTMEGARATQEQINDIKKALLNLREIELDSEHEDFIRSCKPKITGHGLTASEAEEIMNEINRRKAIYDSAEQQFAAGIEPF